MPSAGRRSAAGARSKHAVALLIAAAVSVPSAARATNPPVPPPIVGSPVAVGLATAGMTAAALGGLSFLFIDLRQNLRTGAAVWYTAAALGLGLGGVAVGYQATQSGRCGGDCTATYTVGGLALGFGALDAVGAIAASVDGSKGRRWAAAPSPIVIRTERGQAFGVGLGGVTF